MIKLIGVSVCASLVFGCSAAEPGQAGDEVASVTEALGETACTSYPEPALNTTTSHIGNYSTHISNCSSSDYQSPSYTYNPSGCPRQYILQLWNTDPPPFGASFHYAVEPKWLTQDLTSTTCPQSHLAATVWKHFGYLGASWETPAVGQVTATGHWESGKCVFRRDDNNSSYLGIEVDEYPYEDVMRVAIQAKTGSNYHTVGVHIDPDCVR